MPSPTDYRLAVYDLAGDPLPGLPSPVWVLCVDVVTGLPTAPPTVTELGGGRYSVERLNVTGPHVAGIMDFGSAANPQFRWQVYDNPTDQNDDLVFALRDPGTSQPLAGLAAGVTWPAPGCTDVATGSPVTPPAVRELGSGLYAAPLIAQLGQGVSGIADFGAGSMPRYVVYDSFWVIPSPVGGAGGVGNREVQVGSTVLDQFPAFEDDGYTKRSGLGPGDFTTTAFVNGGVASLSTTIGEIGATGEYYLSFTAPVVGFYELQVLVNFSKQIWHAQYQAVAELTHDLAGQARDQADKIELTPVAPSSAANGSLVDQMFNKDSGKTYSKATDSLEAISDSLSSSSSATAIALAQMQADLARVMGLLHRNAILDLQTYDGFGQLTSARLRVFDSPANVPTTPGGNETVGLTQKYDIAATYAGLNVVTKFTLKQVL